MDLRVSLDLYCTLEVDSYGYFVSKAKTRVFRDTTEPQWNEEFEIELEGSQCLRILCYETCYDKSKLNKDDNEIVDKIMGKGQVQVRGSGGEREMGPYKPLDLKLLHCVFIMDAVDHHRKTQAP
ncbi:hypothetical protein NHX12_010378 [Muraenolepis orangiensis]|uniref:C2 domain-containing protein n=1 Tax=Muraenolepis orangiensis TaxID=630683 RepID=A0A9Q0DL66_9TELE|nr:hypothetical protein NHX12_010378 [Muraenolepis orangiensis]